MMPELSDTAERVAAGKAALRKVDERLIEQLTLACHMLYVEGHNDVNHGQVSARVAQENRCWIRGAALGFDEVGLEDFSQLGADGARLQGRAAIPPEWPIHVEIYAARPDINAIVHTHAPATVVFGAIGETLLPMSHDGCPFDGRLKTFSTTTNTILDREMARAMVQDLGDNPAVLLKNHGVVVVGASIKEAIVLAIMLEKACALQLRVPRGANIDASPADDVSAKNAFIFSKLALSTYWSYFQRKVERVRGGVQLSAG